MLSVTSSTPASLIQWLLVSLIQLEDITRDDILVGLESLSCIIADIHIDTGRSAAMKQIAFDPEGSRRPYHVSFQRWFWTLDNKPGTPAFTDFGHCDVQGCFVPSWTTPIIARRAPCHRSCTWRALDNGHTMWISGIWVWRWGWKSAVWNWRRWVADMEPNQRWRPRDGINPEDTGVARLAQLIGFVDYPPKVLLMALFWIWWQVVMKNIAISANGVPGCPSLIA